MARFVGEFLLIPVPFGTVSAFFFLGEVPWMGVFFALITLATLWYIRPKKVGPPKAAELVSLDDVPGQAPGPIGSAPGGPPTL